MIDCPPQDLLVSWWQSDLPPAEAERVRGHVKECRSCQARLDVLSDGVESSWLRGRFRVDEPVPDGAALAHMLAKVGCFDTPPPDRGTPPPRADLSAMLSPGQTPDDLGQLGSYRIVKELGRGGMGVVWEAVDPHLDRVVALKALLPDRTHPEAQSRFRREAQAAARIAHRHVASIHAVAETEQGLTYLVMERLTGPTLAERIRRAGRLAPRDAAEIVRQAAEGLAAAHAAGVLHRDVKPSNIMFEGEIGLTVKIMDFGLARLETSAAELTREGTLVGTPAYMSPEQAQDRPIIDARADVYGLGVTLYEALTGEAPFRGSAHMILRQIVDEEPRPPRRLQDDIPRDLEVICLKAMAKEPQRRYSTAQALADDLQRWLKNEPIQARPIGRVGRVWRWQRRNPLPAALAQALILAILAGLTGMGVLWRQAEASAAEAKQRATEAETNLAKAKQHLRGACQAVDQFCTRVSQDTLIKAPGLQPLRHALLKDALQFFQTFLHDHGDNAWLEGEIAVAARRLASITHTVGTREEALAAALEWQRIANVLADRLPGNAKLREGLASSHGHLARIYLELKQFDDAQAAFDQALLRFQELVVDFPANTAYRNDLCGIIGNHANLLLAHQRKDEARAALLRMVPELEGLAQLEPNQSGHRVNLAKALNNLAFATPPEEAIDYLRRALALRVELSKTGVTARLRDLARTEMNLGLRLHDAKQQDEAMRLLADAVDRFEEILKANPKVLEYQRESAQALLNLGTSWGKLGDAAKARTYLEQSQARLEALVAIDAKDASAQSLLRSARSNLERARNALSKKAPPP